MNGCLNQTFQDKKRRTQNPAHASFKKNNQKQTAPHSTVKKMFFFYQKEKQSFKSSFLTFR